MPQKQLQLNFPGDNPMHPFKHRSKLVSGFRRKEIVIKGIGYHPDTLLERLHKKRCEYGKRNSHTRFANYSVEKQYQIHAYYLARAIVIENHHAVPHEVVYHAVSLLRRLSPKIRSADHKRELLSLGEEKQMEFSKLNPKHCDQFVVEVKQLIEEQRKKGTKPRVRIRDIATFWDPTQRNALAQFTQHKSVWVPLSQQLNVSMPHALILRKRGLGEHIEEYEKVLVELQNLSDALKKKTKITEVVRVELAKTFTDEYRALKQQLIE